MLVPLATSSKPVPIGNFWSAINLYHERPHLVNRKLCGATTIFHYKIHFNEQSSKLSDIINYTALIYETNRLKTLKKDNLSNIIRDLLQPYDKNVSIEEVSPTEISSISISSNIFITVKLLFASNAKSNNTVELCVLNKAENYALFVSASTKDKYLLVAPPFAYKFAINANGMLQLIVNIDDAETPSGEWLADKLFPKILKWIDHNDPNASSERQESLSLISVEHYCQLYKALKEKYGKKMVDMWPETTDPLKYVYEDVAIATYLICLWTELAENNEKPTFVDLGCGNGLLVYILSSEGYIGHGIDVRKRKIWDLYPSHVNLQVRTILPSDSALFPTSDWIIGNHSDELTPWIPVIAARSAPITKFFLLPCCCFNFDASKYIRKNAAMSQYAEYLQYIESVCRACGFFTKIDKLRIPSTKRTCLVSLTRDNLTPTQEINKNIDQLINAGKNNQIGWIDNYKARESTEKVRNCTQLDRSFVSLIIRKLTDRLLSSHDKLCLPKEGVDDSARWNAGGCLDIPEIVECLADDDLKQLKSECGGLQTLMKNHRYIFEVAKGTVKIRLPFSRSQTLKYTGKPCWFVKNHPDGCLHTAENCAYSHKMY